MSFHNSSGGTKGYLHSAKPSTCKNPHSDVSNQLAIMKNTLHNMMSAMETQNLIYQVPIPLPVDQVAEAHSCVISAIQQDMSGLYSKEEKGQVINYIITNPAADSMYELLSDDELCHAWLQTALSK